jgi:hypothetical protein
MVVDDIVEVSVQLGQVSQDRLGVTEESPVIVFSNPVDRYRIVNNSQKCVASLYLLPRSRAISLASCT